MSKIDTCKVIANHAKYGTIVKCKNIYLEDIYISAQQYRGGSERFHLFTKKGEILVSKSKENAEIIHRKNIALDGNELANCAKQKIAMEVAGYKTVTWPKTAAGRMRLCRQGYRPFIERDGQYIEHELGLVYAMPKG